MSEQSAKKSKMPPPKPTVMPPPKLPTKEDEVWENCALLVDKPLKWTSSDVVCKLRNSLGVKKIGHAGTLDPMATGLLVVCIGKGTKSSMKLTAEDKAYSGVLRLGEATPSHDSETSVSETAAWEHITQQCLQDAAREHFTGELMQVLLGRFVESRTLYFRSDCYFGPVIVSCQISGQNHNMQVPPIFSALKVDGKKMYEAARAGEDIKREPRRVHVSEFRVWRDTLSEGACFNYFIRCGKGTYVRSLVHDLVRL